MYKHLFFNDQRLYQRKNLKRSYGEVHAIDDSVFLQEGFYSAVGSPYLCQMPDGMFRGVYLASTPDNKDYLMAIESEDGIHFKPAEVREEEPKNQIISQMNELAHFIEDPYAPAEERYKLFYIDVQGLDCNGYTMVSPDMIHWTDRRDLSGWNHQSEPPSDCVYNKERGTYVFYVRPDWGQRRVGWQETKDFKTYGEYHLCMQCDGLDDPLAEIYGMKVIPYGDGYLGFPIIYNNIQGANVSKFNGGNIGLQLAYSKDGIYWQRSLREPFLSGLDAETERAIGQKCAMVWPGTIRIDENGDLIIHASVNPKEHGYGWKDVRDCRILAYRVKKDRMIRLQTEDETQESLIATREYLWRGGELSVNLDCAYATLAVYESQGKDCLGQGHELEGYTHADCIPFRGDASDWIPQFKSGKTLDELKGKTLIFELNFQGKLYALEGEMLPLMNLEGARYRSLKQLPENIY